MFTLTNSNNKKNQKWKDSFLQPHTLNIAFVAILVCIFLYFSLCYNDDDNNSN